MCTISVCFQLAIFWPKNPEREGICKDNLGVLCCLCIIEIYVYMFINSLPTNVVIHKVQGFINWFYTLIIGQFGFVEYTSFKYFPIIMKGMQLIYFYFKYKCYMYLLVVNLSEYQNYIFINIQQID